MEFSVYLYIFYHQCMNEYILFVLFSHITDFGLNLELVSIHNSSVQYNTAL